MPKRKITLEEAFAAFEQHGLQVEVKALVVDEPSEPMSAFLEPEDAAALDAMPQTISPTMVKITLYAAHTIGSGGHTVILKDGSKVVENSGIETYGPGIVTVNAVLAKQLLHQDALARQADDRLTSRKFISRAIVSRGDKNVAIAVSDNDNFAIAPFLMQDNLLNGTYIV